MNRRDLIIVAALINAGILIILFISALKTNSHDELASDSLDKPIPIAEKAPVKREAYSVLGDEVDKALSQYSQTNPLSTTAQTSPLASNAPSQTSSTKSHNISSQSFVDDLNSLTSESPTIVKQESPKVPVIQEKIETSFLEVRVKKGDVLEKIARAHQTTVTEIMKTNHLTTTNLKIGQVLKIPVKAHLEKVEPKTVPSQESTTKAYTVKAGDNPWTIAVKNHMKVEDLLKLNDMDEEKARKLKPGDQIRIR